jgi:hypothetical protein
MRLLINFKRPFLNPSSGQMHLKRCGRVLSFIVLLSITMIGVTTTALATDITHRLDFDADGKTDLAVYRPSNGIWYVLQSTNNVVTYRAVGVGGDQLIPGDYDGDQKSDRAVFRPEEAPEDLNIWNIWPSSDPENPLFEIYGLALDVKLQRDYDGDGKTDLTVARPTGNNIFWYIRQSSNDTIRTEQFGTVSDGDHLVPGDFDGDSKCDVAVFRPGNSTWYILKSINGQLQTQQFGTGLTFNRIPAEDYDGDGKADFVGIVEGSPIAWYILQSSNAATRTEAWGTAGDELLTGDYDGDNKDDPAVWRPSNGAWYILKSTTGTLRSEFFGQSGDIPIPSIKPPTL